MLRGKDICDEQGQQCKDESDRDIAGEIGSTGEDHYESEKVHYKNEKEHCQEVGSKLACLVLECGFDHTVIHKENDQFYGSHHPAGTFHSLSAMPTSH